MLALVCLVLAADTKPLDALIGREVERHQIPALSVIVVDKGGVLWTAHHGEAKAGTVYRVGSVSKLFTAMGLAKLAEDGKLSLDDKVDPRGFTLRHLLAHRSGLIREPPVGSYFDHETSSLEKTVASFKDTPLVYPVGKRTKYSNAGVALAGHLLGKAAGKDYGEHLRETLLLPLGMKSSAFAPTPAIEEKLAKAVMWTYHGRTFAAPTFQLGIGPAGSLYSSVEDQGRFVRMLLGRGELDGTRVIGAKTLEAMWVPESRVDKSGFGVGFSEGEFEKRRVVGHNGAVYGFSTALLALPDDNLGVVVASAKDCTNAVTSRIAGDALRLFLAEKLKKAAPALEESAALTADEVKKWAGEWVNEKETFHLKESGGKLYQWPAVGGVWSEVRRVGKTLITDGPISRGVRMEPDCDRLRIGKVVFEKAPHREPPAVPRRWRGLIGEYGPGHMPTIILEKDGRLMMLVEWLFLYPMTEEGLDTFTLSDTVGMYHGEKVAFTRAGAGPATAMTLGPLTFARRKESSGTFKIKPLRPVEDLRKEALKALPPAERDAVLRDAELVELTKLDKTIKLDIRYATGDNFLGAAVYTQARAFLQKPAAEALVRVHRKLAGEGLGLMVFDGYRPWWVTKVFWEATPRDLRVFVADPATGSRHNRGCAVDLTLYDLKTGKVLEMPGGYDEFSDRSYVAYPGGMTYQRANREKLRRAMAAEGFSVYEAEWWHFDYKDWRKYPIGNARFEDIGAK